MKLRRGSPRSTRSALLRPREGTSARAGGFTLAEVAVALVIVGYSLVFLLQALNAAKLIAAQTRNYKLARELGVLTIGQVESGLFREDIENGLRGTYADLGYPDFVYEVVVGDETFRNNEQEGGFDNWKDRAARQADKRREAGGKEDEEEEKPFEKVKVRVTFPKVQELSNELILERWIPWVQVYGEKEDASGKTDAKKTAGAGSGAKSGGK